MNRATCLLLAAATFASLSSHSSAGAQILQAKVSEGKLSGVQKGSISAFLGVPYAAPPVGDLRWKPPVSPASWTTLRRADKLPASCQQPVSKTGFGPWTHEYVVTSEVSEDCLYLNVWTPAKAAGEKLPVMVWIHGGGFNSGSASIPIYDGSALAAKGIVVIGINYRLGVYGFLAHPALTAESSSNASGNYGLMDQITALKWVKANVASFGGDPSRITIAGQSAGAMSVFNLISSPLTKGLFRQAIAQSGPGTGVVPSSLSTAEKNGAALADAAGVGTLAGLRSLTPAQIEAALQKGPGLGGLGFAPIIDGSVLPDSSFAEANTNDVPILTGMAADEMRGMNPMAAQISAANFLKAIRETYGNLADQMTALYPAASDEQAASSSAALYTEKGLASISLWADLRLQTSKQPVYAYLWSHAEPGPDAARYGAFHSSELPYIFGTLDAAPERAFTDVDRKLSDMLGNYWVNWVKTGNPNGPSLPKWPRFTTADRQILDINARTGARPLMSPDKLALFREYVEKGGRLSLF